MQLSQPLSATINATDDGANTVITGSVGDYIAVYGLAVTSTAGSGTLTIIGGSGPFLLAEIGLGFAGSTVVMPQGRWPWFRTLISNNLTFSNAAGLDVAGVVLYRIER